MTTIKFALQMRQDRSKGDWGLRGYWLKTGPLHHWEFQALLDLVLYLLTPCLCNVEIKRTPALVNV